jgi:hypothetical protein
MERIGKQGDLAIKALSAGWLGDFDIKRLPTLDDDAAGGQDLGSILRPYRRSPKIPAAHDIQ